ncbi:insertion element iso-iS1d protein insA [Porphyromonadaceae bacterium COT-184 OH4590]|nr:insertion element iso-iS1d protein insA [Porphyromonadaceae bacterium COT-184 OH4590]
MACVKCKSDKSVKNGIVSSRQRYRCNDCGYNYTVAQKSDVKPNDTKKLALAMYIEGLSYRTIGKILNISYGTVYQWVKDLNKQTKMLHSDRTINITTIEQIEQYVVNAKSSDRHGLILIDMNNGTAFLSVKQ